MLFFSIICGLHDVFDSFAVHGGSMEPTLQEYDNGLRSEIIFGIKRFSVVIADEKGVDTPIIKRVIALPGEKIEYKNNRLFINDRYVEENFISPEVQAQTCSNEAAQICHTAIVLKEDEYFLMGDNRINSLDSRYLTLDDQIKRSAIKARAVFVYRISDDGNNYRLIFPRFL